MSFGRNCPSIKLHLSLNVGVQGSQKRQPAGEWPSLLGLRVAVRCKKGRGLSLLGLRDTCEQEGTSLHLPICSQVSPAVSTCSAAEPQRRLQAYIRVSNNLLSPFVSIFLLMRKVRAGRKTGRAISRRLMLAKEIKGKDRIDQYGEDYLKTAWLFIHGWENTLPTFP